MTDEYVPNVPHNSPGYNHLLKYHTNPEYRQMMIKRSVINDRADEAKRRYNHYKRLTEDKEYLEECKSKGLRLRKVPEEFLEVLKELVKN